MKGKFRIKTDYFFLEDVEEVKGTTNHGYFIPYYMVQMKLGVFWCTIKTFNDTDSEYAKMCAEELLDKLEEE